MTRLFYSLRARKRHLYFQWRTQKCNFMRIIMRRNRHYCIYSPGHMSQKELRAMFDRFREEKDARGN